MENKIARIIGSHFEYFNINGCESIERIANKIADSALTVIAENPGHVVFVAADEEFGGFHYYDLSEGDVRQSMRWIESRSSAILAVCTTESDCKEISGAITAYTDLVIACAERLKIDDIQFGGDGPKGGDFVIVSLIDEAEEEYELYAENCEGAYYDDDGNLIDGHDEWEAFPGLCEEIVEQAAEIGIKRERIIDALKKAGVPTDESEI